MITDDLEVSMTADRLQILLREEGARPLDDRQADSLARLVLNLQGKIDDLDDLLDDLHRRLEPCTCESGKCRQHDV